MLECKDSLQKVLITYQELSDFISLQIFEKQKLNSSLNMVNDWLTKLKLSNSLSIKKDNCDPDINSTRIRLSKSKEKSEKIRNVFEDMKKTSLIEYYQLFDRIEKILRCVIEFQLDP